MKRFTLSIVAALAVLIGSSFAASHSKAVNTENKKFITVYATEDEDYCTTTVTIQTNETHTQEWVYNVTVHYLGNQYGHYILHLQAGYGITSATFNDDDHCTAILGAVIASSGPWNN